MCFITNTITNRAYLQRLNEISAKILAMLNLPDEFEVELDIIGEAKIQELNNEYRGCDSVTDVLSFPYTEFKFPYKKDNYVHDINPESDKIMLGSIVICEQKAKEQAYTYGHSEEREVMFLALHGLLHLMGFEHETDVGRERMRALEKKVLDENEGI